MTASVNSLAPRQLFTGQRGTLDTREVSALDGKPFQIAVCGHTHERVCCHVQGFQGAILFWPDELVVQ